MSDPKVTAEEFRPPESLAGVQTRALVIGVGGLAISVVGLLLDREQFFRSYLVAWIFWAAIALACLGWQMVQHLSAGYWGLVLRRALEAGARTLPFLFVMFVPLYFGMESVWEWSTEHAAHDELIQKKAAYLNVPFFWARTALYFAIWTVLAYTLSHYSRRQDETGAPEVTVRLRNLSGPGVVLFVLVCTFACWDWLMSLDPHWFSSLYGFYFVSSTALTGMLFMIVCAWWLAQRPPLDRLLTPRHFHDYGKLSLALVMFWAYMTLSQFLITWAGHVPEFTVWYQARNSGGWRSFTYVLVLFHFFVPFLLLLSATLKKQPSRLVLVACYLLVMRWVDLYWQAAPSFHAEIQLHWLDATTLVGVGGVWVFLFVRELRARTMVPIRDPYFPELLAHE